MRDRNKKTPSAVAAPMGRWRALAARCLGMAARGEVLSASWHNVLCGLFLGGLLAYGAAFAWYMLARFDLVNLIRDVSTDDSFYYFQIAHNLAEGKFSTFDGGITRTNGYHPLWLFLITPFYWVFDKEAALFGIKAFEIMLVAAGVALVAAAARLARLPWVLLFAALPMLYHIPMLIAGMEAAAALFMLGLFMLTVCLFARSPTRWQWPLAAVAFALPWVRLEYIAISLAATAALCLIEWSWQERAPSASLGARARSVLSVKAVVPFLAAGAGLLVYFAYNWLVFGGIVPVSGVSKQFWSQDLWESEGGYSLTRNIQDFLRIPAFDDELGVVLEVFAYLLLVWWFARHSRSRQDWLLLAFLAGVFGLAAGHLAKFAQSVLTVHPYWGSYPWYFVPAHLMMAVIIPVRCYVAIYFIRRFVGPRSRCTVNILGMGIVVIGVVFLLAKADFTLPFRLVDWWSKSTSREWEVTSFLGTMVMDRLIPEDSVVGSWDAGAIGYFSRFPVVNLDGLVNSYDYMRARREGIEAAFYQRYGITHFANVQSANHRIDAMLFEGPPYLDPSDERRFKLSSAEPLPSGFDRSAKFWERMAPHFDYQSESVAVVVDGNMAQAFARDCAPAGMHDEPVVLSWPTEGGETVSLVWRPWEDASENSLGFCVNAFELPNDAHPPIRIRTAPAGSIHSGNHLYLGEQVLARFEDGFDGWLLEGEAVTNHGQNERYRDQSPISGNKGRGFLTSYHPDKGDLTTGRAFSPAFTAESDQYLTFLIAGGVGSGVGLRLLAGGDEAAVWRGENTERFKRVVYPLAEVAGQRLQLELFDNETGGWGHIMLDSVMLARRQSEEQSEEPYVPLPDRLDQNRPVDARRGPRMAE